MMRWSRTIVVREALEPYYWRIILQKWIPKIGLGSNGFYCFSVSPFRAAVSMHAYDAMGIAMMSSTSPHGMAFGIARSQLPLAVPCWGAYRSYALVPCVLLHREADVSARNPHN